MTSFFLYKQEVYEITKKENPGKGMFDLTKIVSEKWKNLDETSKSVFEKRASEAYKKYLVELKHYEEKCSSLEANPIEVSPLEVKYEKLLNEEIANE